MSDMSLFLPTNNASVAISLSEKGSENSNLWPLWGADEDIW